jgi:two-component system OmpR family response regulator
VTGGPPAHRPLHLLVVDDEQQILELLDLTLSLKGYVVWTAPDGPRALEVCRQRPIDVIVMEVQGRRDHGRGHGGPGPHC